MESVGLKVHKAKTNTGKKESKSMKKETEHVNQLQRLQEKDPDFFKYLEEHGKDLLNFKADDANHAEDVGGDTADDEDGIEPNSESFCATSNTVTASMVDDWKASIPNTKIGTVRSILRAFREACHCGDSSDDGDESMKRMTRMSSTVFNKVMILVLMEMDGILRRLLKGPSSIAPLMNSSRWKKYGHMVKSYLGNALHVLSQMNDSEMISFTLRRLRRSSMFLSAFPAMLKKYMKVVIHFWGTGEGGLPLVSLVFLRDVCVGHFTEDCFKGMYRAYVSNCQFRSAARTEHVAFLRGCLIEVFAVDVRLAYQVAFVSIRQLVMMLRDAMGARTKESFRKVYEWKFVSCLELWTGVVCASEGMGPLAYPLVQVIGGVARLVSTARYFPLRLRCVGMMNRISASTGLFVPVSAVLLDMLEMKELRKVPSGGVGNAVDMRGVLKVGKQAVRTRAFHDACVGSVVESLAQSLALRSRSAGFYELAFIPVVRLRAFCKATKVERHRKQVKELLSRIEDDCRRVVERRRSYAFVAGTDPTAVSFMEVEDGGSSSLVRFAADARERSQRKSKALVETSVVVRGPSNLGSLAEDDDMDDGEQDGSAVFSSSWLPVPKENSRGEEKRKKRGRGRERDGDDDVVEDLVLSGSSDEEDGRVKQLPSASTMKKRRGGGR